MKFAFFLSMIFVCLSCNSSKKADQMKAQQELTNEKVVIYQMMTRLFGNTTINNLKFGTKEENGVGKFNDISVKALGGIKELGITHIWYTGVLEHAIIADYSAYGIAIDDADVVKGRAGSPYAIKDYYDVNPDLAENIPDRLNEFKQLVSRTHAAGMQVVIDFVPNHVARKYVTDARPSVVEDFGASDDQTLAFSANNNFYYLPGKSFEVPAGYEPIPGHKFITKDGKFNEHPAKVTGNDKFDASPSQFDWFETVKLNYGVDIENGRTKHFEPIPDTWHKMKEVLSYWASMGIDGFRCDMAEMVPVEFWGWVIPQIEAINPEIIFIAEIYNPKEYENYLSNGKFSYLYDKVELYDTLRHIIEGRGSTDNIAAIIEQFEGKQIDKNMLRFMENHDEQRLASRFFAGDPRAGWPAVALSATISNGPMMIYFGQEVGEPGLGAEGFQGDDGRTTIFDYWGVPEHQKWMNGGKFDGGALTENQKQLRSRYAKLLKLCNTNVAIREGNYIDLHKSNQENVAGYKNEKVYAFVKRYDEQIVLIVCNFDSKQAELDLLLPESLQNSAWETATNLLDSTAFNLGAMTENTLSLQLEEYEVIMLETKLIR
jgi:glycosidase